MFIANTSESNKIKTYTNASLSKKYQAWPLKDHDAVYIPEEWLLTYFFI
jgi:hypothetical protein